MKFLLAAINAKYIHSNLGIYSLKKYGERQLAQSGITDVTVTLGEYTINHRMDQILMEIYRQSPDAVGFSCYIWNIEYVIGLVRDLHKILPDTEIWLGGPEVSYDAGERLERLPDLRGILMGEGEQVFGRLLVCLGSTKKGSRQQQEVLSGIPGLAFRQGDGQIVWKPAGPLLSMDDIPFAYGDLADLENRIIYYESSRGCPFACSYCLSSIDKTVRFRSFSLVKEELSFFLERRVPQVKFVDRTFNCKKSHAMDIWRFLLEQDNGVTNFHFEISADLLDEDQLAILERMRPGLVQLEIGVQSANPVTIGEIRRTMDLDKLEYAVDKVNRFSNIHQHLDLIAGLPWEDYESFQGSFDRVYRMRPQQLQLGFLKVLKGSHMAEMAEEYGLRWGDRPPYEVLCTNWLDYGQMIRLKGVEEMVEVYYNSGQFPHTIERLEKEFESPFGMFEALADYYEDHGLFGVSHNRQARYEILFGLVHRRFPERGEAYRDLLIFDLYLRENAKSRPSFAMDQTPYKTEIRDFFIRESREWRYLKGYEGCDSRQIGKMAHLEVLGDGRRILFDYRNRDALWGNASSYEIKKP